MPRISCDEVIRAEHGVIEDQRARRGVDRKRSGHVGLALSGGGYVGVLGYFILFGLFSGVPIDTSVYKLNHFEFPNQSTADQFFSERQFEAYREIGYRIAKQMLAHAQLKRAIEEPRAHA